MDRLIAVCLVLVLPFILYACSGEAINKEKQVEQFIDTAAKLVESRSLKQLSNLIHKDYRDHNGLQKSQLSGLIQRYFFMHKNIYLLTKTDEIVFHSGNKAQVVFFAAIAGNVITDMGALSGLRAKIYRFDLQLIYDKKWLLALAQWRRSDLKEMMQTITTTVETL